MVVMRWRPVFRGATLRLVVGLSLVGASALGGWWLVGQTTALQPYLVTQVELPAGAPLDPESLDVVYLAAPAGAPGLLQLEDVERYTAFVTRVDISAGSLLSADYLELLAPSDVSQFTLSQDIGGASWLRTGGSVDIWISAPGPDQQFLVPRVVSTGARVVALRQEEGFAANQSKIDVDVEVAARDIAQLVHASANGFDIRLTPSTGDGG